MERQTTYEIRYGQIREFEAKHQQLSRLKRLLQPGHLCVARALSDETSLEDLPDTHFVDHVLIPHALKVEICTHLQRQARLLEEEIRHLERKMQEPIIDAIRAQKRAKRSKSG